MLLLRLASTAALAVSGEDEGGEDEGYTTNAAEALPRWEACHTIR